jgi:uncharacterized protein
VGPRLIFVDTSFWIATAIDVDARHAEASALVRRQSGAALATSNLVVGETWTFVNRRFGHRGAVDLVDRIRATPRLRIERVSEVDERDAWSWLRARDDREYSFVDATSFALMRRLAIREALAFDGDFAAAGFVELRA